MNLFSRLEDAKMQKLLLTINVLSELHHRVKHFKLLSTAFWGEN